MDSSEQNKLIAPNTNNLLSFDTSDFSSNLVHVHTEKNESPLKSNLGKDNKLTNNKKFVGAKLLSTSEYKDLKKSVTSFNRWFSQTTLLSHLVEEASPVSGNSSNYLKKDSFFLEGDAGKEDEFYDEFGLFFDKSNDGTLVNKSVVTFLLTNFSSPDNNKQVTLEQGMASDFNDFKIKFMELLNDENNEIKLKRALLTVAFNHYGCSVVKKFMTLDEYNSMLKVHKVFHSDALPKFVFDSMDRKYKSMLTLNEFVSGMLSCSPDANHNLNTSFGKLRLQHIFRAYDLNRLGYLHQHSLELMLNHLSQLSGDKEYFSNLEELSENILSLFSGKLSYDSFFYCVEHDMLKDTMLLFRSNRDMAKSMKDFLVNSLDHVLPGDKPKQKTAPLFSHTSLENNLSEKSPKDNHPLNRDFTFGSYSEKTNAFEKSYEKQYENTNLKTTGSPVARHSIWSHTPRVYSEFNNNKTLSKDSMYNFAFGNNWSKSNYSSQTQKPQNPIDRVAMLYNEQEDQLTTPKSTQVEHKYKQDNNNYLDQSFSPTKETTTNNAQFTESDPFFDDSKPQRSVERTPDVISQDSEDLFADASDSKPTSSLSGNNKLDELLKEYNLQPQTPQNVLTTEHKPFATLKDTNLFEDVFEDEAQLHGNYKETKELLNSHENKNQFDQKESPFKFEVKNEENNNKNNKEDDNQASKETVDKTKELVGVTNLVDDPVGDPAEEQDEEQDNLDNKVVDAHVDTKLEGTESQDGVVDVKENFVVEPNLVVENPDVSKSDSVVQPNAGVSELEVSVNPDTGCSGAFSRPCVNYSTLEALTEQLSKFYKSKYLIFKGLLIDDSVARNVFTKFLSHSLGDSTDHKNLDLCTFSDILQLCDSVCSLLRKEDSLLELKGDFQVFASMNGDLSCVLDFFNTYGWPMVKKKVLEDFNLNQNVNPKLSSLLKNNNWMDFDHSYLFMGGFVSDLSCVSLEFVIFMFSLKVLFPYHVYFLRSYKDERNFTNDAGFYDELYRKLSQKHSSFKIFNDETFVLQCSKELFHRVNDVFEFMSVAAVLNNKVLCVDRLTENFTYSKLANLPKPLSLSTCDQEQVYDLLFNRSCSTQFVNNLHLNGHNNNKDKINCDNYVNVQSQDPQVNQNTDSKLLTTDSSTSVKSHKVWNSHDFNKFKLVLCSSDELNSGYKQLMNNKLLLLSTNFNKKKDHKVATSVVFNRSKLIYRSLKL